MNKSLVNKIRKWKDFEQKLRFQAGREFTKTNKLGIYNDLVYIIDSINNLRIKEIISKHGYPTRKLLGTVGMKNFWLLIQHQDEDLDLQLECLANSDFAPVEKAYLTDRVLLAQGKKQKYGTQFTTKKGKRVSQPIDKKSNVNAIRKSVGLESLEKYLEKANSLLKKMSER